MIYNADTIQQQWTEKARINGRWVLARPLSGPFWWRVKAAWGVLTGRYDALEWTDQPRRGEGQG
jgi:hypothetical protein